MSSHSLLAWRVSIERSAVILMGIFLCAIYWFSLAAFNIFSLPLIFASLINMCLAVLHLWFVLFWTLWASWTWVAISFHILGKFPPLSPQIFSHALSFCLLLGHLWFECLTLSQWFLKLSSFLLIYSTFFLSASFISTIIYSTSLLFSSTLVILLLVLSRVALVSVIYCSSLISS